MTNHYKIMSSPQRSLAVDPGGDVFDDSIDSNVICMPSPSENPGKALVVKSVQLEDKELDKVSFFSEIK